MGHPFSLFAGMSIVLTWYMLPVFLSIAIVTGISNRHRIWADELSIHRFERQSLTDTYFSEGISCGDINGDGQQDVVYGPYWFEGPDFTKKHEIYEPIPQPMDKYADHFFSWVYDIDSDGANDVFTVGFPGTPAYVYKNPGSARLNERWKKIQVIDWVSNESPQWTNLVGDARPELVCTRDSFFGFATVDWTNPLSTWQFHPISEKNAPDKFGHGLGVGDINGDGRMDILKASGWFEQPAKDPETQRWREHKVKFTNAGGGAEMYAYDVDGDGDNDVITSQAAHEFGLAWYEQVRDGDEIRFVEHMIMGKHPSENRYGVLFSELHSVNLADMDGDGLKDIVTGKTYYSHHQKSPMWDAGAVVYWFKLVRSSTGVDWIPYQADDKSGIGRQVVVHDINRDGQLDIATGGMLGAHVLIQKRQAVDAVQWKAAQPKVYDGPKAPVVAESDAPIRTPGATGASPVSVAGAIEGETLSVKVTGGATKTQAMGNFAGDRWSGGKQLWWTGGKPKDTMTFEFDAPSQMEAIEVVMTCAKNYGIVQWFLDGQPLSPKPIDLYRSNVVTTGVLSYPTPNIVAGKHTLTVEIVGANSTAQPAFMVGLDYFRLRSKNDQLPAAALRSVSASSDVSQESIVPLSSNGRRLNLDFETGTLEDWTVQGLAFEGQPIEGDTVAERRTDMQSNHQGKFWIGGFEKAKDQPQGSLTSVPFKVTARFGSFWLGGGEAHATRVELYAVGETKPFYQVSGKDSESMSQVVVDLRRVEGKEMLIRLVDESSGGWGHLNFDHFRFHTKAPAVLTPASIPLTVDDYPHAGLAAEAAAAAMKLPEGFRVTVCAAEPEVQQPIAMALDDRGRTWIAEAYEYPVRAAGDKGRDRILIFEDLDGDGKFDSRKVFAEGLNLVSGLEVGFGGVWVGAAPYLLFIPDKNGDDVPDAAPQILLDGWGYQDTHETLNAFIWGPDGWLYGCHGIFTHSKVGKPGTAEEKRVPFNAGVWRYHPTKHTFEVFAHGTSNPWGVDFNENGDAFITACVIPHLFHMIPGARYHRQAGQHFNPNTYNDIKTIADHLHYLGATPHGGNGKSDAAGGGHAHAGAMIYLGGQWPEKYRGAIFMNNIHGQRLNVDLLEPRGSGYVGKFAPDFLLTGDAASQILNMRYGPDGQVTMIDWYDMQACHSKEVNKHDRSNGRIYKISYGKSESVRVDLRDRDDVALVEYCTADNEWYYRHARRLLQERAEVGSIDAMAVERLLTIVSTHADKNVRLRALWAMFSIGEIPSEVLTRLAKDDSPYVRSWVLKLGFEQSSDHVVRDSLWKDLVGDPSPVVRLALASVLARVPVESRWAYLETLSLKPEDALDHNLPLMWWYAVEPLSESNPDRALAWAITAGEQIPLLREYMLRRVAGSGGKESVARLVKAMQETSSPILQSTFLKAIQVALAGQRNAVKPDAWDEVAAKIMAGSDSDLKQQAIQLGVVFGDRQALQELRSMIENGSGPIEFRKRAIDSLVAARDSETMNLLLRIASQGASELRELAIQGLAVYDDAEVARTLLKAYPNLTQVERRTAMATLCSRAGHAKSLLKAMESKQIAAADLPADLARQIEFLGDDEVKQLLVKVWGQVRASPAEKSQLIAQYKKLTEDASLSKPDEHLGRTMFVKTCQRCHTLYGQGQHLGPDLTGSNRSNLDYLLENVVDPSAVMANEYRQSIVMTDSGQVISGIVRNETDKTITLQTTDALVVVPKDDIEQRKVSEKSMMPDDQLNQFSPHEIRSLLAYLRGKEQVPLLATSENASQLFNGKDLTLWKGNTELWSVKEGEIIGKSEGLNRNEFLVSEILASDFTLSLEIKLVGNIGNSGVQFRSVVRSDGLVEGYQADAGPGWWGKLYEEHGRKLLWNKSGEEHLKVGDWNHYLIEARGSKLRTSINGATCVDLEDPAGRREGIFAFQLHSGGPTEVRFRNIQLTVPLQAETPK
jgi:putative membrane-bound dehydrogenase-like protein